MELEWLVQLTLNNMMQTITQQNLFRPNIKIKIGHSLIAMNFGFQMKKIKSNYIWMEIRQLSKTMYKRFTTTKAVKLPKFKLNGPYRENL